MSELNARQCLSLLYDWRDVWARPQQLAPPGNWLIWLIRAGRGFGKNRAAAEWIRETRDQHRYGKYLLVGETAADARDYMVEGDSGILAVSSPDNRPAYRKSLRRLDWPDGAYALTFSADDPEQLRGYQCECFWADEVGKWKHDTQSWDNLMFGFRVGLDPRGVVSTTPRNTKLVRELLDDPNSVVTGGNTYDNADNLAPAFIKRIISKYEGTELGKQEIYGLLIGAVKGALWRLDQIHAARIDTAPESLSEVVVAIDPAVTADEDSDDTGIIVCARDHDEGYVLEDATGRYEPYEWAEIALDCYFRWHADRIVAEVNNGGDLVISNIKSRHRGRNVPTKKVWATRGKEIRAAPIAGLYQQRRIHHIGQLAALEDELTTWVPNTGQRSPNRMDALVWGLTDLFIAAEELRLL